MEIGFIGLGKLGLPCAEVLATKHKLVGYDINPKITSKAFTKATDIADAVVDKDIVFIAVPTPHAPKYGGEAPTSQYPAKDFDYSYVLKVLDAINYILSANTTVALISTVLPGTIRNKLYPHLKYPEMFVYNPYLIAMGTVKEDFQNPEMIIMGTESGNHTEASYSLASAYKDCLDTKFPRYELGTWEEAECIKIFYNTFISMKISYVNMIQDVAEKLGNIDVDVVTGALTKSDQRLISPAYMKAGMGDGGACHPRDNIALKSLSKNLDLGYDLFGSIMFSREEQAKNLASFLAKFGQHVMIIGKSFKANSPLIDGSYSLLVAHYLGKCGVDPLFYDEDTGDTFDPSFLSYPVIALIGHWSKYTESVVQKLNPGSIIVDPWREYSMEWWKSKYGDKHKLIHYGNRKNRD